MFLLDFICRRVGIGELNRQRVDRFSLLNPFTTISHQDRTSPHSINIIPSGQLMGIKKNINKGLII